MAETQDLTQTAGSHPRWPESMAPSSVNDSARLNEGIIVRWFFDTNYSIACTVSGTVVQMTANRVSLTLTGTTSNYMADLLMAFTCGSTALNGPGLSVNINGIGPISLRDSEGVSLSTTFAVAGTRVLITKDSANNYFRVLAPPTAISQNTYTPGNIGTANIAAHTEYVCQWMRVGSVVTVSGRVTIRPTASATLTTMNFSLPVTGGVFASAQQLGGTAFDALSQCGGAIFALVGGARASLNYISTGTIDQDLYFTLTYLIV